MPTYTTRNNRAVETDSELGKGGEGVVYSLRQNMMHVAKIYHASHRTQEKEQKLLAMIANPPQDDTRQFNPFHISISWPVDVLYERGQFAGYLMPKIATSPEIFEVFNPVTRRKKYPGFDWRYAHHTAQNLAIAMNALHVRGYVMGDVNQKNVLVAKTALITIVDTDSFQVRVANSGRMYRCPVGVPEYTPPELQGISLSTVDRVEYHDNFGLAVLIFQLLMDGNHPFMGVPQNIQQSFGKVDQYCIKQGIFPYHTKGGFMPPPHAPEFNSLHPEIQRLFLQTFEGGFKSPSRRANPLEWMNALQTAEGALIHCKRDPSHWYSSHNKKCHWCEREIRRSPVPAQTPLIPHITSSHRPVSAPAKKNIPASNPPKSIPWKGFGWVTLVLIIFWRLIILGGTLLGGASPLSTTNSNATVAPYPDIVSATDNEGAVLVYVPAGEFTMGSNVKADEQPIHKVKLNAFWIDQTEVTNAMYAKCVNAGKCEPPRKDYYFSNSNYANHPVVYVDWNKANAYCSWVERRLPTEAEWEKASRGTEAFTYPWGNYVPNDTLLNYNKNVGDTTEVGTYPNGKSTYGAYDMAGNVWEWVNDWYSETYYQNSPSSNPLGPDSGQYRVLRGGSWYLNNSRVRSANRQDGNPMDNNEVVVGFRCARSLP